MEDLFTPIDSGGLKVLPSKLLQDGRRAVCTQNSPRIADDLFSLQTCIYKAKWLTRHTRIVCCISHVWNKTALVCNGIFTSYKVACGLLLSIGGISELNRKWATVQMEYVRQKMLRIASFDGIWSAHKFSSQNIFQLPESQGWLSLKIRERGSNNTPCAGRKHFGRGGGSLHNFQWVEVTDRKTQWSRVDTWVPILDNL